MEKPRAWHGSFGCVPQSSALRANSGEGTRSPCVMPRGFLLRRPFLPPLASFEAALRPAQGWPRAGVRTHSGSSNFASRLANWDGLFESVPFCRQRLWAAFFAQTPTNPLALVGGGARRRKKNVPPHFWAGLGAPFFLLGVRAGGALARDKAACSRPTCSPG